ncbi:Uncharacterised protein [Mycobacteroides abscessus subsp. abscessus]|uniref:TniQ family protein n=1 Tax=Mycobacteroides abscessus TaxID=36809 RepID=UPI000928013E|nr:RNA binding protein [Mycobacterium phage prophiGD15-1]SIG63467.1 Uncharacterised protein [Mycobacteroides abscessus subsp. abscessus]SIH61282.1 Uncharacterised protein [Mycobacteroides abscessus subsp. abscessus]SII93157.1 Uncharacterised protein [Mycobacteroides abscessus subsp. abscessus]SIJ49347.1 Uncharacterised protein [Mycobacteroides abscessus subsp. abscessus]
MNTATAAGRAWPAGPRQRLPRVVTPFRTETVSSYIDRLAHANHLTRGRLQYHVAAGTYQTRADWLAVATGIAENILRERLIGFGAANGTNAKQQARVRPACRLCMARRGVYEPVHCWLPAYETVCFRHLRWIGPGAATWEDQHDLSNHPDIVVAARRHRQLIRAHRDLAGSALSEARHILTWWSRVNQDSGDDQTDPTTYLQAYPDLITIATVLADHRHQVAAGPCTRHPIWSEHLLGLINTHATTIRDDPRPLQHWIDDQRIIARIRPPRHKSAWSAP